jgi:hypothetical protein
MVVVSMQDINVIWLFYPLGSPHTFVPFFIYEECECSGGSYR